MTDEELAEKWIKEHSGLIGGYKFVKYDYDSLKQAFLAGLKAGKDMAEADLATVAYMQGAERYKPKWHYIGEEGLPEAGQYYFIAYTGPLGASGSYCKLVNRSVPGVPIYDEKGCLVRMSMDGSFVTKEWDYPGDVETRVWLNENGRVYAWMPLPALPEVK